MGNIRPSIVKTGSQKIEFVAALGPVFRFPQVAVRIAGKPLRIAEAAGNDFNFAACQLDSHQLANVGVRLDNRVWLLRVLLLVPFIEGHGHRSREGDAPDRPSTCVRRPGIPPLPSKSKTSLPMHGFAINSVFQLFATMLRLCHWYARVVEEISKVYTVTCEVMMGYIQSESVWLLLVKKDVSDSKSDPEDGGFRRQTHSWELSAAGIRPFHPCQSALCVLLASPEASYLPSGSMAPPLLENASSSTTSN